MPSLAAFRYRNVLGSAGGPIDRLEMSDTTLFGQRQVLANAYLREGLVWGREDSPLYGPVHGSGTAASPMVARFMAISEALERWAHWQLHRTSGGARYGFDVDPSSNGMAAFPGLFKRQARRGALLEAAERFNILNWWEGRLPAQADATPWAGVRAVTIRSGAPGRTVILFKQTEAGFFAYGHAAAGDFAGACRKAAIEMERHALMVTRCAAEHGGRIKDVLPATAHPIKRRSLFFAREEGHQLFLERLRASPARAAVEPKLVFDGPVPGPWDEYVDVWRVVYEPPNRRFVGTEEDYFML